MSISPKRFYRKLLALAKIEVTEGTDVGPTALANAIELRDVTFTPLAGDDLERQFIRPYFGHQGVDFAGEYGRLQFTVDFAGSGVAGTPPAWGVLKRACGYAETIVAATSVTYEKASDDPESVTIYVNIDGVNHVFVGARGKSSASMTAKQVSSLTFELTGLLGPIADVPLPAATYSAWKRGLIVSKANTPVCTLFAAELIASAVTIDFGQSVTPRHRIYEESIAITDAKVTGSVTFEAKTIASGGDWFERARAVPKPKGQFALQHGTVAGNIIEIEGTAVEIGRPTYAQVDGIWDYTVPLFYTPTNGDDEISIVVR